MTDLSKWTQKAQEALQKTRETAIRFSHQQLDTEHLLAALLDIQDGLAVSLLQRLGVAIPQLHARVEEELERKPRVSGDVEEGKIYVTQALNELLVKAGDYAKRLKDEYVSGSRVAYAKFDGYVPRQEAPSRTAGGKIAYMDRVEWTIMPDSATLRILISVPLT